MAEEKRQSDRLRLWIWRGAGVFIVIVFFAARFLMRDRLLVREVQVRHQELVSTVPTNGRVEPDVNYQFHSPLAGLVKKVNVHPGDVVPAGKLLIQLDDLQAEARMATAESGVKAAQAMMESITTMAPCRSARHPPPTSLAPSSSSIRLTTTWTRSPGSTPPARPRPAKLQQQNSAWPLPKPASTLRSRASKAAILPRK